MCKCARALAAKGSRVGNRLRFAVWRSTVQGFVSKGFRCTVQWAWVDGCSVSAVMGSSVGIGVEGCRPSDGRGSGLQIRVQERDDLGCEGLRFKVSGSTVWSFGCKGLRFRVSGVSVQ